MKAYDKRPNGKSAVFGRLNSEKSDDALDELLL
jgi:hypothetical protein